MAEPTNFAESNGHLDGTAMGVPPLYAHFDGKQVVTCWKLNVAEIAEVINNGGRVWLVVMGPTQPPVTVSGFYPFVRPDQPQPEPEPVKRNRKPDLWVFFMLLLALVGILALVR